MTSSTSEVQFQMKASGDPEPNPFASGQIKQIPEANASATRGEVPVRLTGDILPFAITSRMRDYGTSDMLYVTLWNVVVGCARTAASTSVCAVQWKSSTLVTFPIRQSSLAGVFYLSLAVPT